MQSYAVLWADPVEEVEPGKLELESAGLRFEGAHGASAGRVHRVYYEDIEAVHVGRDPAERVAGKPALVLDLAVGGPLRIASIDGAGTVNELVEELARLTATRLDL
jgi:hypothetical protein